MKDSKKNLLTATLFLLAALLFIPAAVAQTENVPKVLFIIAAILEITASVGFFWNYFKGKK